MKTLGQYGHTARTRAKARRRAVTALLVLALVVGAGVGLLLRAGGEDERRLVPAGPEAEGTYDPLAYDEEDEQELARRATAGLGDVLWEKSPGGVPASARRTARWRPLVERAARAGAVDPDLLEAIVLLESGGREDAVAGGDVEGASGLAQILAGTATDLLDMSVDLERSRALTAEIAEASDRRSTRRLRAQRRRVDDRFDPAKALQGAARYLALAKRRFGRDDLAVASYHMGIGNLESVMDDYGKDDVSYTRIYFDTSPLRNAAAYERLSSLGDDSSTYLWRVLAAREIMRRHREQPAELERLWAAEQEDGAAARRLGARSGGDLRAPPPEEARALGLQLPSGGIELRPEAVAVLLYLGAGVKGISAQAPLVVREGRGSVFDVQRSYRSREHALAFEFMLDRLQAHGLIAWRRAGRVIRVAVGRAASDLLPSPERVARDATRAPE